jgi:hypothetical protein
LLLQVTRIRSFPPPLVESTQLPDSVAPTQPAATPEPDEVVHFEMVDGGGDGKNWRLHQTKGSLRLGRAKGSLSTVEVVVTPLSLGYAPAPRLVLRGVTTMHADDMLQVTDMVHVQS